LNSFLNKNSLLLAGFKRGGQGSITLRLKPQVANAYFSKFAKVFNFSSFKKN